MFLVLAAQYESLTLPIAIILIVPMGLLAAMTGVWLTKGDNNVFTQIGLVVLVGLSAKNAILIVEFARELEFAGRTPVQAAIEASRLRLRPILMTSLAFVMGVLPLVLSTGAGAEMRRAMGVAVFSGMIGVTAFGLFLTPVFYVLMRRLAGNRPLVEHGAHVAPISNGPHAGAVGGAGAVSHPVLAAPARSMNENNLCSPTRLHHAVQCSRAGRRSTMTDLLLRLSGSATADSAAHADSIALATTATAPATVQAARKRSLLAPLAAALVLAGCMAPPVAPAPHAGVHVPATFNAGGTDLPTAPWTIAPPAEAQPRGEWWLGFQDPVLADLVQRAGDSNTSIQQAAAHLAEARSLLRSADAARAVQVGASTGVTRQAGAATTASATPATLGTVGLNASYELDLFGRLSQTSDAARLDALAQAALLQSTRLMVQADVAQTYLQLRSVQAEQLLVQESLTAYQGTLRLTQVREQAGDLAELDVARVLTEVAATESEGLALQRQQALLTSALAVLTGEVASGFSLPAAAGQATLPVIPPGVPGTVLARRPDVSAAQTAVLAAQARVGVARKAWFRAVTLTGNAGHASPELGDLFRWSARAWGVSALLSLPLMDGGQRNAQIEGAKARLEAALADHRGQVLNAFRDVEDQLASLRLLAGQAEAQGRAVTAARRATQLSDARYRNGLVSQLELLDARRSELRNRRQALQVRTAQYVATVGLIRALGGGWGDEAVPVAAATCQATPANNQHCRAVFRPASAGPTRGAYSSG